MPINEKRDGIQIDRQGESQEGSCVTVSVVCVCVRLTVLQGVFACV